MGLHQNHPKVTSTLFEWGNTQRSRNSSLEQTPERSQPCERELSYPSKVRRINQRRRSSQWINEWTHAFWPPRPCEEVQCIRTRRCVTVSPILAATLSTVSFSEDYASMTSSGSVAGTGPDYSFNPESNTICFGSALVLRSSWFLERFSTFHERSERSCVVLYTQDTVFGIRVIAYRR